MNRRSLILGALAAPFVVRTPGLLMPVKPVPSGLFSLADPSRPGRFSLEPGAMVLIPGGSRLELRVWDGSAWVWGPWPSGLGV